MLGHEKKVAPIWVSWFALPQPCCEDTQAALWRGHVEKSWGLQPTTVPASQACGCSSSSSFGQASDESSSGWPMTPPHEKPWPVTLDFPDPQKQWKMIHICLFIELRVDWFNYLFHGGKIYIKWNLPFQLFLSAQFSGIKYIHFVMKPLPPSISTEFFMFPNWNSVLIKQ